MRDKNNINKIYIALFLLSFVIFFLSLTSGRYCIDIITIMRFCIFKHIDSVSYNVLMNLRLYRIIVSFFVGISLSLSGIIYQNIFNNVLVSPDILGVSTGASAGACLAILLGLSSVVISIFAFAFAVASLLLCLCISKISKNNSSLTLILAGISISGLMSSIVGLLKYLADTEMKLSEMTFWLLGDLSKVSISNSILYLPIISLCIISCIMLSWKLNIISLGMKETRNLGINYKFYLIIFVVLATIMTALSVSMCGVVTWIGLVVPNICRILFGSDNRKVIPVSIFIGGIYLMVSDTIARTIAPNEVPLSVITGILGTPFFVFILMKYIKYEK